MNNIRTVIFTFVRSYARKTQNAGIRGQLKLSATEKSDSDYEELGDDMGLYDSDFMNVGESYATYQRETREMKEKLKQRIVKSKYFKDVEPNFLTFTEKDEIRKLHESNPEEWTPEKLSNSFPALPDTVRKVLKSKWTPQSVDVIIRYDNKVIENWKKFKTGKIVVNPRLNEHLMKFRNRIISPIDRKVLAEKFIPPEMEFPKPQSTLFRNIIKDYVDDKESTCSKQLVTSGNNEICRKENMETGRKHNMETNLVVQNNSTVAKANNKKSIKKAEKLILDKLLKENLQKLYTTSPEKGIALLDLYRKQTESENLESVETGQKQNTETNLIVRDDLEGTKANNKGSKKKRGKLIFDEFVEKKLQTKSKTSPEERIVLLDLYRKQVESKNVEDVSANVRNDVKIQDKDGSDIAVTEETSNKNVLIVEQESESQPELATETNKDTSLDTHVKEWNKNMEVKFEYTNPIKIPKNVHKEGMLYRIKDCYYDDDGEFLYRVPGIWS